MALPTQRAPPSELAWLPVTRQPLRVSEVPSRTANAPPELVESFGEIRASALSGLNELRRVLGVLRSDQRDVAPQPGPDYEWVEGYWYPQGNRYRWHDGYWTRPPAPGSYWVAPYWSNGRYYEGYWGTPRGDVRHDHRWDGDNRRRDYDHDHDNRDRDNHR